MKKKVLFLVTKSNFGGAQRYVFDLATHLSDEFEPVVAFGPPPGGGEGRLEKMLREKGVRTIVIPELMRDVSFANDYTSFRAILNLLRTEQPKIVHLNSSKVAGLGALAARIAHIPSVFTVHGWPFNDAVSPLNRFVRACFSWLTAILADTVIVISQNDLHQGRRMPFLSRKLHLIYNGIESPAFFTPIEARKALSTIDPGIGAANRVVGYIGELHPNKNPSVLIDACARLPDVHLILIGDGELKDDLKRHAEESGSGKHVHFLGYVPEAARYFRAFDVFALSSLKEGLPYVLLEAGHAYVPVVASDIPGVHDVILPDFTGILANPHDPQSFTNAILRILNDATLARSLAGELLTRMQKTFSFDRMLEKTQALYRN